MNVFKIIGWGRPNFVHNVKEKTYEAKWKNGMIGLTKSHAHTPRLALYFKCAQCELKVSKIMLKKEWSCNMSKILS